MPRSARLAILALVSAGAMLTVRALQAQGGAQSDMAAINTLIAQINRGYTGRDSAVILATMAGDVQAFGSAYNANGVVELKPHSDRVLATLIDARLASRQDVTLSGNLAYVSYLMDVQMKTDQGPRAGRTRWTVVFRRANSKWAVAHIHVSRDPTM